MSSSRARTHDRERKAISKKVITARGPYLLFRSPFSPSSFVSRCEIFFEISPRLARVFDARINFYFICRLRDDTSRYSGHERARLVTHRKLCGALPLRHFVTLRGCSLGAPFPNSLFPSSALRFLDRARTRFAVEKIGWRLRLGRIEGGVISTREFDLRRYRYGVIYLASIAVSVAKQTLDTLFCISKY